METVTYHVTQFAALRRVTSQNAALRRLFNFTTTTTMADDIVLHIPNLHLPQYLFTLSSPNLSDRHHNAREELLKAIETDGKLGSLASRN